MTTAGFFEVVSSQRACRSFSSEEVRDEELEKIMEAAVHAPSAQNSQPWVFVVVRDPATRGQMSELTRRLWSGGARDSVSSDLDPRILEDVEQAVEAGFGGAPVLIVVGADTSRVAASVAGASVFPAVQNLLLAATALGLGSALTNLTVHLAAEVRSTLAMPDHVEPLAVVPVGRPAKRLGAPRREPVSSKAHRERFGIPW